MGYFGYIAFTVCIAYVSHSVWTMWSIYNVQSCDLKEDQQGRCYTSALQENKIVKLILQGTATKNGKPSTLIFSEDINPTVTFERKINITLPRKTKQNGTYYITAFARIPNSNNPIDGVPYVAKLTKFTYPMAKTFNLMSSNEDENKTMERRQNLDVITSHFRSKIVVSIMTDDVNLNMSALQPQFRPFIGFHTTRSKVYLPMVYVDELSFRLRDLVEITGDMETIELTINYQPITAGKLKLLETLKPSMKEMRKFGFGDKELDEVKGIFTDTHINILLLTIVVSIFHLLFDFLAFKNDIQYWRKRKTMVGLSTRAVVWRTVSTIIIFLYLQDQNTSLLVLVPAGISSIIELWKLKKAFKVTVTWTSLIPNVKFGSTTDAERETSDFDATAMYYINFILYPCLLLGAIYSLLYTPHKSWYSWCIQTLVNGVYAFGFIFMLPQLFVNYKLKSVAHLPWKAFMYKAFNTFIDDIFAFIITMPTAHRLACFRDDVVFVVYLYQRWLYPVDKTRVNEYGQTFDEPNKLKQTAEHLVQSTETKKTK